MSRKTGIPQKAIDVYLDIDVVLSSATQDKELKQTDYKKFEATKPLKNTKERIKWIKKAEEEGKEKEKEVKAMAKYRFTKKRKRALAKARSKWKHMSKKARKKAMPNRRRRRR